jgi:hypothetical protein
MKYILINIKNTAFEINEGIMRPERVLFDDGKDEKIVFICEKCFKTFYNRNLPHLEKCRLEWPTEGICADSKCPYSMLFKINNEKEILNRRLINSIINLAEFSKLEQGIDNIIPTHGLLKGIPFFGWSSNRFYCYVLFDYKNIIAYCWIQVYSSLFAGEKVVIRDIYVLPWYRHRNISFKITEQIAKDYNKEVKDLMFSMPISQKLKGVLKKNGLAYFVGIQGENLSSIKKYDLSIKE